MTDVRYVPPGPGPADIEPINDPEPTTLPFDMEFVCNCQASDARVCWAIRNPEAFLGSTSNPSCACACHGNSTAANVRRPSRCSECDGSKGFHKTNCPHYR